MAIKINPANRKRILISLAFVAGILVIFLASVNTLIAPIISRKIKSAVLKSSDSLYIINFSKLKVNIFAGTAEIEDIALILDTVRRQPETQIYEAQAKSLVIKGAHPFRFWFSKELEVGQIILVEPVVKLTRLKPQTATPKDHRSLYQRISKSIKFIHVDGINLEHAKLEYSDKSDPMSKAYHLKELTLAATDLLIDSATQKDTARTLFCQDINISIRNFTGISDEGNYHYKLRSASFSTQKQLLVARGIKIAPIPVSQFFKNAKTDRFGFNLDSLVISRFKYGTFLTDHYLEAPKISAIKGSLEIYANPNGRLSKSDRIVTFPNYIIRSLKPQFSIDTLDVADFDIQYQEYNMESSKTGTLTFKNTKARFLHLSNQPTKLDKNVYCTTQISSLFMGAGKLDLNFAFNLTDKVYAFQYSGHMNSMPLVDINPLVMPLAMGKINSGQLHSLDFKISGNRHSNTGTLKLLYNDLNITLLDRNYHAKPLKTLLANTLVVKHDNPDQGTGNPRFAKVIFIRPKNYPFFKTLWETLLSGIKPCAGIGYAVKPVPVKSLSKKEKKAHDKALKKALKEKKKQIKNIKNDSKAMLIRLIECC